ncbi:ethanolamine utilization protein EutJ [Lentilactobacillus raoultii]|uniref:Ethanolamine utilization protein EutJ n=1 Tax=Lentilactobacillus raoultii TaxID=1987503 RepID=A0ABW3PIU8_9LACO|nr:ethanolamine utilization protein EutJ [Lentilactobacillus raoultii]
MKQKDLVSLKKVNKQLTQFAKIVNKNVATRAVSPSEKVQVGIDLGTSSIVMTVLDENSQILYGSFEYDTAVRDGIVVNFMESVNILTRLKEDAESVLGVTLETACGAIPPGTGEGSAKIVANVIESAGFVCRRVVDEPTAAARFLGIKTGTVVDIGGGTTGISIFKNGQLIDSLDEATGGFHMTLVLAGHNHIDSKTAEKWKRDKSKEKEVFSTIRPVVEKMAIITQKMTASKIQKPVVVVGGAINFEEFIETFSKVLGISAEKPDFPQFVTPLGIAMYDHD